MEKKKKRKRKGEKEKDGDPKEDSLLFGARVPDQQRSE